MSEVRLDKDAWGIMLATVISLRATCARRRVGCVLTDKNGIILSTGYNGVASGMDHCTDQPCPGAHLKPGEGLDICEAVHAEQNALLQCQDVQKIDTIYITCSPCITCTKLLLNTSCSRIIYMEPYVNETGRALWLRANRIWHQQGSS